MNKKLYNYIITGDVDKFYNDRIWRKKRRYIIERDNKECQKCKRKGGYSKATCVHHKKHLKEYPLLALDDDNLEALCDTCHNEEHPEKLTNNTKEKFTTKERWE